MRRTSENLIERAGEDLDEAISTDPIKLYLHEIGKVLLPDSLEKGITESPI